MATSSKNVDALVKQTAKECGERIRTAPHSFDCELTKNLGVDITASWLRFFVVLSGFEYLLLVLKYVVKKVILR